MAKTDKNPYIHASKFDKWVDIHYDNGNKWGFRCESFAEYQDAMKKIVLDTSIKKYIVTTTKK